MPLLPGLVVLKQAVAGAQDARHTPPLAESAARDGDALVLTRVEWVWRSM